MNRSRLVWGIVCVVVAVALAVLWLALPAGSMVFTVGDANVPWLPALILGVVGIVLLALAKTGEPTAPAEPAKPKPVEDPAKAALNKRLETIAWALFLIILGCFMLVPQTVVAKGIWSIAVGLIMLGLNLARYRNQLKMSGLTTVLGIISVIGGILGLFALKALEGSLLIIILGVYLIAKPWFDERRLFGKAEEA